jgi:hypothetical protein
MLTATGCGLASVNPSVCGGVVVGAGGASVSTPPLWQKREYW